jgi:hypothetical protein
LRLTASCLLVACGSRTPLDGTPITAPSDAAANLHDVGDDRSVDLEGPLPCPNREGMESGAFCPRSRDARHG